MQSRLLVFASSLFLALIFATTAVVAIGLGNERLETSLLREAERLKTAFEVSQAELEHQMLALATTVAADEEIRRLLTLATETVTAEGGGRGQTKSAEVRRNLLKTMSPRWVRMRKDLGLQQMQFVLPGNISFLRMHAPDEYGDSLQELRAMLRETERTLIPQSGFETGRAYAGVRGAVPVTVVTEDTARFIGTLELGITFDGYIARLSKQTGVGFGILLKPEAVSKAMWEEYRPSGSQPTRNHCCYLLSASKNELGQWLDSEKLPPYHDSFSVSTLEWQGSTFQFIQFPLVDYLGKSAEGNQPIGSVAIWRDVSTAVQANRELQQLTIAYIALAYVVTQILLLFVIRLSRREWQKQLRRQTLEIKHLLEQNEALLMTAGEGIYGVDPEGKASFINPAALRMLGVSRDEIIGQNQHEIIHHHRQDGSPFPYAECPVSLTLADGQRRSHEDWFIRRDGTGFPVQITVAPIMENDRQDGAVVVFRDITELKEKEDALVRLARTDPLTGVASRRFFLELLSREIGRHQRTEQSVALMMCDLDFFKRINDTFGHGTGDLVLRHFTDLAQRTLREIDIIGRVGGEEFAMLLPGCNAEQANAAAERLRQALENEATNTGLGPVSITVSTGITLLRQDDKSTDQPLQRADEALYAAKSAGRNCVRMA